MRNSSAVQQWTRVDSSGHHYCTFIARKVPRVMARDRRSFGRLRKLPSGRYQAAYVGPDDKLHVASATFGAKVDAEAWLTDRRREIDRELWSPPVNRRATKGRPTPAQGRHGEVQGVRRADGSRPAPCAAGRSSPRTVEHYESMLADHIYPTFGARPVRDITMQAVDRWYARTLTDKPTLRAHCYSLLRTILETRPHPRPHHRRQPGHDPRRGHHAMQDQAQARHPRRARGAWNRKCLSGYS